MKEFKRYLIHFSMIISVVTLGMEVICIINNDSVKTWFPLTMFGLMLVVYALPMAYLTSSKAKVESFEINIKDSSTFDSVEKFICEKTKRTNKLSVENKIIYSMENKYSKWLTNPISVEVIDDNMIISGPTVFIKDYKNFICNTK